jgi:hypothetical protein
VIRFTGKEVVGIDDGDPVSLARGCAPVGKPDGQFLRVARGSGFR